MPEQVWDGKYGSDGAKTRPVRMALPFQDVETVNESAQERSLMLDLFARNEPREWRNRLIWGANLRYYYPDFVVRLEDGERWLVETKGAETVEVAHKDRAATLWCENATLLTGTSWQYLKVPQKEFMKLQPSEFADLEVLQT